MSQVNLEGYLLSKEEQIQFLKHRIKNHRIKIYKTCRCGNEWMLNKPWNILCAECYLDNCLKTLDLLQIEAS